MNLNTNKIRKRAKYLYESTDKSLTQIAIQLAIEFNISEQTATNIIRYRGSYYEKKKEGLQPRRSRKLGRKRSDRELDDSRILRLYKFYSSTHKDEPHTRICMRVALKMDISYHTVSSKVKEATI